MSAGVGEVTCVVACVHEYVVNSQTEKGAKNSTDISFSRFCLARLMWSWRRLRDRDYEINLGWNSRYFTWLLWAQLYNVFQWLNCKNGPLVKTLCWPRCRQ